MLLIAAGLAMYFRFSALPPDVRPREERLSQAATPTPEVEEKIVRDPFVLGASTQPPPTRQRQASTSELLEEVTWKPKNPQERRLMEFVVKTARSNYVKVLDLRLLPKGNAVVKIRVDHGGCATYSEWQLSQKAGRWHRDSVGGLHYESYVVR